MLFALLPFESQTNEMKFAEVMRGGGKRKLFRKEFNNVYTLQRILYYVLAIVILRKEVRIILKWKPLQC